ncbi:MAG: hypothetical protein ACE5KE_15070, partial [Methanosarcinales archaeon]
DVHKPSLYYQNILLVLFLVSSLTSITKNSWINATFQINVFFPDLKNLIATIYYLKVYFMGELDIYLN